MLPLLRPRAPHLDGRNFSSSSWKSTFSSFLHLVFRTRADRRFAVSPLSSEIFFRFTPFLDLSPPETSPLQREQVERLGELGHGNAPQGAQSFYNLLAYLTWGFSDIQEISCPL